MSSSLTLKTTWNTIDTSLMNVTNFFEFKMKVLCVYICHPKLLTYT